MPLSFSQKSDVRRHLKYPVAGLLRQNAGGGTLASGAAGWRFFNTFGFLEYKLNNLNPDEEARLVGSAYGAIACIGNNPNVGDTITATFSGGPLVSPVSVVATALVNDTPLLLINRLAVNAALTPVLVAAGFQAIAPYGSGPFSQNAIPVPEVAFTCPQQFVLTISSTSTTAQPILTATGEMLPPTVTVLSPSNSTTSYFGYLPILNYLEGNWAGMSDHMDTWVAGPWTARKSELKERELIYDQWTFRLGEFLDIPYNPYPNRFMNKGGGGMRCIV